MTRIKLDLNRQDIKARLWGLEAMVTRLRDLQYKARMHGQGYKALMIGDEIRLVQARINDARRRLA